MCHVSQQITDKIAVTVTRYKSTSMQYDSQGRPDNQTIAVGGWWRQYRLLEVTSGRGTWQERNLKLA
jgi:hypothetical protein